MLSGYADNNVIAKVARLHLTLIVWCSVKKTMPVACDSECLMFYRRSEWQLLKIGSGSGLVPNLATRHYLNQNVPKMYVNKQTQLWWAGLNIFLFCIPQWNISLLSGVAMPGKIVFWLRTAISSGIECFGYILMCLCQAYAWISGFSISECIPIMLNSGTNRNTSLMI